MRRVTRFDFGEGAQVKGLPFAPCPRFQPMRRRAENARRRPIYHRDAARFVKQDVVAVQIAVRHAKRMNALDKAFEIFNRARRQFSRREGQHRIAFAKRHSERIGIYEAKGRGHTVYSL